MLSVYLLSHGGSQQFVPDALQIRRFASGAAAGDEQIAAVLKMQRSERRIAFQAGRLDSAQPLVGRQIGGGRPAKIQRHPAEKPAMVRQVIGENGFDVFAA